MLRLFCIPSIFINLSFIKCSRKGAIRKAWCGCLWMGASMGHVDPLKEVNAAEARIRNNISTQEQEAAEYNGNDWNTNMRQRRREIAEEQRFGITQSAGGKPAIPEKDEEEQDE